MTYKGKEQGTAIKSVDQVLDQVIALGLQSVVETLWEVGFKAIGAVMHISLNHLIEC